jgi:hypothetical protein
VGPVFIGNMIPFGLGALVHSGEHSGFSLYC